MKTRTVTLTAAIATLGVTIAAIAQPLFRRDVSGRLRTADEIIELEIPPGTYNAILITAIDDGSDTGRLFTIRAGSTEYPLLVEPGTTFTVPFDAGWTIVNPAVISPESDDAQFIAWGVAPRGPVKFEPVATKLSVREDIREQERRENLRRRLR